ncbi:MAG TPA: methyltransferase domain-containing protein [Caulobacteraceae bacterium]|jgi:SAM-dependent methyltransferase
MSAPPRLFDRALHRRRLDRAASRFAEAGFLKTRACEDAIDRIATIMRSFPVAVDLGARDGTFARLLAESPARDRIGVLIEADLSGPMLAGRTGPRVVLDDERLPFGDASLDLVVSTLSLHWANDLPGVFVQARRALKPDGVFIASILGGGTLYELRQSLTEAETEIRGGAGPRVSPFADAEDAAGLLQRAGFKLPVADFDRVSVRYRTPLALLHDLQQMGETNVLVDRPGPLNRAVLTRAFEIYGERFATSDGGIEATFEVITATGWSPQA